MLFRISFRHLGENLTQSGLSRSMTNLQTISPFPSVTFDKRTLPPATYLCLCIALRMLVFKLSW
ncbi:hypothetical protein QX25_21725 [Stutzerimonas stutzeri]|nr:hypothetical protein QX25_21725 [Stutzerimonas stutzeri]